MAEGKCIKIIKSAPYLVVMTAGNTICCCHALRGRGSRNRIWSILFSVLQCHALRGRGSRNLRLYKIIIMKLSHALRGRGSRNTQKGTVWIAVRVTPCEGVGVEIYNSRKNYNTIMSRLARAWE